MPTLIVVSEGNDLDLPENQCSECDEIFSIMWSNDGCATGVEFCPFCGAEFE